MKESTIYEIFFRESSSVMLLIEPSTGNLLDANNSAVEFYGYTYKELMKMRIFDINILPENEVKDAMSKVINRERNSYEFKHKLHNGDIRDVSVGTDVVTLKGKNYICSIIRDISKNYKVYGVF